AANNYATAEIQATTRRNKAAHERTKEILKTSATLDGDDVPMEQWVAMGGQKFGAAVSASIASSERTISYLNNDTDTSVNGTKARAALADLRKESYNYLKENDKDSTDLQHMISESYKYGDAGRNLRQQLDERVRGITTGKMSSDSLTAVLARFDEIYAKQLSEWTDGRGFSKIDLDDEYDTKIPTGKSDKITFAMANRLKDVIRGLVSGGNLSVSELEKVMDTHPAFVPFGNAESEYFLHKRVMDSLTVDGNYVESRKVPDAVKAQVGGK
ncbi:MAG: hypothetical protein KAG97_08760, partial [Victivallales bacterium]|nr:hypothetical protein [Victivallales bacterium]